MKFFKFLNDKVFGGIISVCGILSTVCVIAIMFAYCIDCVARFAGNPVYGVKELSAFFMAVSIYLGIAYAQRTDSHIKVTVLLDVLPPVVRNFMVLILDAAMMVFFGWMATSYWGYFVTSWTTGMKMEGIVAFPYWPVKLVMFLGTALFAIQLFIDCCHKIGNIAHPKKDAPAQVEAAAPEQTEEVLA